MAYEQDGITEEMVFLPEEDLAAGTVVNESQTVQWRVPDIKGGKFLLATVAGLGIGGYGLAAHPHAAEAAAQPATEVSEPQRGTIEVTVHGGQTVYGISKKYGDSVAEVADFNRLHNPHKLRAGQKLLVPVELQSHAVAEGDTLYSLARHYGTTVEAIARINGVSGSKIIKGHTLYIPVIDAGIGTAKPQHTIEKVPTATASKAVGAEAKPATVEQPTPQPAPMPAAESAPPVTTTEKLNIDAIGTYNGVDPNLTKKVVQYLIEKHGFSPQGAAYFTASGIQESGLRARPAGSNDTGTSHGGWQLHNERAEGMPQDDLFAQIDFIVATDMKRDKISAHEHVLDTLRDPNATAADVRAAIKNYERYAPGAVGGRFKWGRQILEDMLTSEVTVEPNSKVASNTVPIPQATPTPDTVPTPTTAPTPVSEPAPAGEPAPVAALPVTSDVAPQGLPEQKPAFSAPQPTTPEQNETNTQATSETVTSPPAAEAPKTIEVAPLSFEGVDETAKAYLEHAAAVTVSLGDYEQFAAKQEGSVWPKGINTSNVGVFNKEISEQGLKGIDHLILHWTGGGEDSGDEIAGDLLGRKGKCCSMQLGMDTHAHTYAFTKDPATKVAGALGMNDKGHSNNGYSIGIEVAAKGMPGSYVLSNGRIYNGDPNETGYTDEQQQQLVYVMTWLCEKYNLLPDVIVGHEAVSKEGKTDVPPQYAQIVRAKVGALLAAHATSAKSASDSAAAQLANNLGMNSK